MIKIYTSPMCCACKGLKAYLTNEGIKYEEIDASVDQEAFSRVCLKAGKMELPTVEVDGKYMTGFNLGELKKLLNKE